ncbi:unnamed protein product [Gadus morhua 'NCC']
MGLYKYNQNTHNVHQSLNFLIRKGSAMESRVNVGDTDTEGEEARTVESVVERVVVGERTTNDFVLSEVK